MYHTQLSLCPNPLNSLVPKVLNLAHFASYIIVNHMELYSRNISVSIYCMLYIEGEHQTLNLAKALHLVTLNILYIVHQASYV